MTRHKKTKFIGAARFCAVIAVPVAVAAAVKALPQLGQLIKKADSITLSKTENVYAQRKNTSEPEYTIEFSEDYEDIINEEYIISEGYGYMEETEDAQVFNDLENPLYAVINEPNSTMQRLIRKLNILDAIDEQSSVIISKIFEAIPKIAKLLSLKDGYRVVSNIGEDGCQSVKHLHFHILGGERLSDKMA